MSIICTGDGIKHVPVHSGEEDYAAISSRHGDVGSAAKYSRAQPPGDCQLIAVCWDRVSIDPSDL